MTALKSYKNLLVTCALAVIVATGCEKSDNPLNLPEVSPSEFEGTIDGYTSSDEIFPQNLVSYWSFDQNFNETTAGYAPTLTAGNTLVDGGVRGKALNLNAGYLYYAMQFPEFKTDSLKSFSISVWVKILNNGTKRTMLFQLARPTMFTGNINFHLNTQQFPATNTDVLRIQPTFTTVGGGTQDNLNNNLSPKIGNKWTHIVLTYDGTSGVFNIWGDAVKIGGFPNRGTGNNLFKSYEPSEVIIGSNYNGIPGKQVNTDVSIAPMTGQIDELKVWNRVLPDAHIKALFKLGQANK